jgi:uncharacterized membrane protein YsdA (DUF1294 family)
LRRLATIPAESDPSPAAPIHRTRSFETESSRIGSFCGIVYYVGSIGGDGVDIVIMMAGYVLVINVSLFTMMGLDKRRSKKGSWRIQEKKLWTFAALGGAFGGWIGMNVFRHKTKHPSFKYGLPALSLLYIVVLGYLVKQFYL